MKQTVVRSLFAGLTPFAFACASSGHEATPKQTETAAVTKTATAAKTPEVARTRIEGPATVTTKGGAKLSLPAGFAAEIAGEVVTLIEPDKHVRVAVVEGEGEDLEAAVAAAWTRFEPAFPGKAERVINPPPRDGWDGVRVEAYALDAKGEVGQAVARRKDKRVFVSLVRGTPADLDKRSAQIRSFLESIAVPGLVKLDLSTMTPKSIEGSKAELDAWVEELLAATHVPGLELAVIEDGRVVHARGYGVRELGKKDKVDADTLMMIGSVTKSMTTLLMASLVDEGKLSWNAKVTDVLPSFKVDDEKLTKSLEVEQLVCACAGLPRKDLPLVLEFEKKKPEDVFAELAHMKPTTGLRETFQYQNHMVAAGGYLAAHALDPKAPVGLAYDRAMKARIFDPLEMKRTTLDFDAAIRAKNRASPHAEDAKGEHHVVPIAEERFATFVRPSGGVWSSANDMAKYLMNELARGARGDKKPIASEKNLTHRWEQQVAVSADSYYGLGWGVGRNKGLRQITHTGGTMGFATLVAFFPEANRGVVMIANSTSAGLVEGLVRARLIELWYGIDDKTKEQLATMLDVAKKEREELLARSGAPDEALITSLLGRHVNDELGQLELKKTKDGYAADFGAYVGRVLRLDRPDGKRVLVTIDGPLAGLELVPLGTAEGTLEVKLAQERYVFTRPHGAEPKKAAKGR